LRFIAVGAARYGLDGAPYGEVTEKQASDAASTLAQREARRAAAGASIMTARKEAKARAKPAKRRNPGAATPATPPEPAATPALPAPPAVKRLGLADLKRAAQERRAGSHAHA